MSLEARAAFQILSLTSMEKLVRESKKEQDFETAGRVVFLTAQTSKGHGFGRVLGLGKYPYFLDWTCSFASRSTCLRCGF